MRYASVRASERRWQALQQALTSLEVLFEMAARLDAYDPCRRYGKPCDPPSVHDRNLERFDHGLRALSAVLESEANRLVMRCCRRCSLRTW